MGLVKLISWVCVYHCLVLSYLVYFVLRVWCSRFDVAEVLCFRTLDLMLFWWLLVLFGLDWFAVDLGVLWVVVLVV